MIGILLFEIINSFLFELIVYNWHFTEMIDSFVIELINSILIEMIESV